jgi:DNA-binding XRE family transcriptional regulator
MLERTRERHTESEQVYLGVICQNAVLDEIKAILEAKGCFVRQEVKDKEWYTIEEFFPNHHAGDSIRGVRYREGLTQRQLAEKAGISIHNLSNMEHGRRPVGKDMAKRLAGALNTDWRLLLS